LDVTRFVVAAGLSSYGIDLAEDVLDCLPEGRGTVRELARALVGLLPVHSHLDPLHEPEAFRVWLLMVDSRPTTLLRLGMG
jgi:hypothetical protein